MRRTVLNQKQRRWLGNIVRREVLPLKRGKVSWTLALKNWFLVKHWRLGLNSLFLLAILAPGGLWLQVHFANEQRYVLSASTRQLLAKPSSNLAKLFKYDSKNNQYIFNAAAFSSSSVKPNSVQVGGSGKDALYGVKLAADPAKGETIVDKGTQLSFSLSPLFGVMDGKSVDSSGQPEAANSPVDHLVFPTNQSDVNAIYTVENNGVKEDLVLNSTPKNGKITFNYKLNLPDTLAAKLDSNGNLNIYSADPALFGNISYGSNTDQQKVMEARSKSAKDHLLFVLPVPVIYESGSRAGDPAGSSARFNLKGNILTVSATGLSDLHYPATIDPSVVDSAANLQYGGNNEGGISYGASNNMITTASLTGGTIGSWTNETTEPLPTNIQYATSAVYNGYVYILGGQNGTNTLSAVYYAVLNSDGSVGAWTPTTALPKNLDFAASAVYDGYIYEFGGYDGTTTYSTVYYAPIKADGSLGNWATDTASPLPQILNGLGAVAYKDYMYIIGGNNSVSDQATTYYARINADGSLGSWTNDTASPLPYTDVVGSVVAYNGYIYELGGYVNGSGSPTNYTFYAPINADGSIGTWVTGTLPQALSNSGAVAYDGYIYILTGLNGSSAPTNIIDYAPLGANGSIGTWNSTTTLSDTRAGATAVGYNGYLYLLGGGYDGSQALATTFYAQINQAGTTGSFLTSSNVLPGNSRGASEVAYNGYLYVMGGWTVATSAPIATVYAAPIHSDGNIGAFTTTGMTALPLGVGWAGAVAYGGYMYTMGGCDSALGSCNSTANNLARVYSAPIGSTGTIGTWSFETAFTGARFGEAVAAYSDYLYVIGGVSGTTYENDIQYTTISSGTTGASWTTSAYNIGTARNFLEASIYGGDLYIAGGCTAGPLSCTAAVNSIQYAPIGTSGDLNAGLTTNPTSFTNSRGEFGMVISLGYIYVIGGADNGTYYNDVQFAPINNDGSVGSWMSSSGSTLSSSIKDFGATTYNGYIYVEGGYDGTTSYASIQYASINNGGSGTVEAWNTDTSNPLPIAVDNAMSVAYNGYIYELGGFNGSSGYAYAYSTKINSDGSIGAWSAPMAINACNAYDAAAVAYKGYIYIVSGEDSVSQSCVSYAQIGANGVLGSWVSATSLPSNYAEGTAVAYNGFLYYMGGFCDTGGPCSNGTVGFNTVYYVPINADGSLGSSWNTTTALPQGMYGAASILYNGYVYVLGGNSGTAPLSSVYYAPINSDGTLGSWNVAASLPQGLSSPTAVSDNGYVYVLGGSIGSTAQSAVYFTSINSNGSLGNWMSTNSLLQPVASATSMVYNGYAYELGGYNGSSYLATVYYAGLDSIPRIGRYSRMVDLTGTGSAASNANDPDPTSLTFVGSATGNQSGSGSGLGGFRGEESLASSSCLAFGSINQTFSLSAAKTLPILTDGCGNKQLGHYVWTEITIDDSQTATFPDVNSNHSSVNSFSIYYAPGSASRLRGGGTFSNGSLQTLYTKP